MNWHQIVSQALSYIIAGIISAGPLGLAAKFYLDRSLKRLEASNEKQLETFRDELNQKRDSRQALIGQSNYATQKALEIEFKCIQDIYAGIAELQIGMDNCRPFMTHTPASESQEERFDRMMKPIHELNKARNDMLHLIATTRLFYPENIYDAAAACLKPVTSELLDFKTFEDSFTPAGILRAQDNREAFYPLATHADRLLRQRLDELKRLPD
jgi:hypothetical protein